METKVLLVFSIWILSSAKVTPLSIPIVSDIQDMIGLVTEISDLVTGQHALTSGDLFKKKVDPTLAKVGQLSDQINQLTQTLNVKVDKLMTAVLTNVPRSMQFANLMRKLIALVTRIDELFDDYQYYVNQEGNFTRYTVEDFSKVTTSHKFGDVQDVLRQAYHLFIPGQLDQRDESLLDVMEATLDDGGGTERCNQMKTGQQQVYDLYETVIITEIKGFIMTSYAYGLLAIYQNESFANEMEKVRDQTVIRCSQYLSSVADALERLPREIYRCDPPKHIRGETYVQLNAIQVVVIHESMAFSSEMCEQTCQDVDTRTYFRNYKYPGAKDSLPWRPNSPCEGRIYQCGNLGEAEICELPAEDEARYGYIKYGNSLLGTDGCPTGNVTKLRTYIPSFYQCTTCFCECSAENAAAKEVRTISLRPQLADIDNNMVVTGVRFELKDMMIHVQIEQGKLVAGGKIQKNSTHLLALEDFTYLNDVSGGGFSMKNGDSTVTLEEGTDYRFIRYRQRDLNLDILTIQEPGYLVTGLKMSLDPEIETSMGLEVYLTPYDFWTGSLVPTDEKPSKWVSYKDIPGHDRPYGDRHQIDLKLDSRSPINFYDNVPNNDDFTVIWFVPSDQYAEMGQNTVPFFDRQLVAPSPRIPLENINLNYRTRESSGGFLGFKVTGIDISKFLNPIMTPENVAKFKDSLEDKIMNHAVELE